MSKLDELLPAGPDRDALLKELGPEATLDSLVRGFINTKHAMSSTRRVPGVDASPEDWHSFYNHLGRPGEPGAYQIPASASENMKLTLDGLRNVAFEKGLTQEQFKSLADSAITMANTTTTNANGQRSEWEKQVRERLGDKADARLQSADARLQKFLGDPAAAKALKQAGLDRHPAMVELMLKVGDAMAEDSAPVGDSASKIPGPTGPEIYNKLMTIMDSVEYKDTSNFKHAIARQAAQQAIADIHALKYSGVQDPRLRPRPSLTLPDGTKFG